MAAIARTVSPELAAVPAASTFAKAAELHRNLQQDGDGADNPRFRKSPLEAVDEQLAQPQSDIKAWQKLLSATGGALLTSLTTTPLEVVKTRMQTVLPSSGARASTFRTAMEIVRREGVSTLWSGLKPSMMMQIPSTALYFTAYDELKSNLEAAGGGPDAPTFLSSYAPLMSGILSRSAAATAVAPLELLRTMAMYRQSSLSSGVIGTMRSEIASGGWRTLWRGLGPTLLRDVPFSGIYWLGYERMKKSVTPHVTEALGGPGPGTAWLASFLSGLVSGSAAALLTTPFDVVKTRKQVQLYEEVRSRLAAAGAGTGSAAAAAKATATKPGCSVIPSGIVQVLRTIAAEEGLSGLFAGVGVRIARVGPACAIMISAYELGKWAFLCTGSGSSDSASGSRSRPPGGSGPGRHGGGAAAGGRGAELKGIERMRADGRMSELVPPEAVEAAGD